MLKNLVKIANRLDSLGLSKEADVIDNLIQKFATDDSDTEEEDDSWKNFVYDPSKDIQQIELDFLSKPIPKEDYSHMLTDTDEDLQIDPETIIERSEMYSGEPSSLMGEHRPYMHELFPRPMKRRS
jgi:hypothetical protein